MRAVILAVGAVLMVLLLPSSAWAVVDCGTQANPCVMHVTPDDAQASYLHGLVTTAVVIGGVLVFVQLVALVGSWGRR